MTLRQQSLKVTEIDRNYRYTNNGKALNKIIFETPTGLKMEAEELSSDGGSFFRIGFNNVFEVTHPGKGGGLDWIRFISSDAPATTAPPPGTFDPRASIRDNSIQSTQCVMQAYNKLMDYKMQLIKAGDDLDTLTFWEMVENDACSLKERIARVMQHEVGSIDV